MALQSTMLCGDIKTEMVEHEICLLTCALSHVVMEST